MRISDWSSDVCSSDLWPASSNRPASRSRESQAHAPGFPVSGRTRCDGSMASAVRRTRGDHQMILFLFVLAALASGTGALLFPARAAHAQDMINNLPDYRSEEHTSELQSLMRISYAVFCLKQKKNINNN